MRHRRDNPLTPPSPRQSSLPIIPRRTLPLRNRDQPLTEGSLRISPTGEKDNNHAHQRSFNSLLPIENQKTPLAGNLLAANEPSMIISPMQSSTPEPPTKSPSVVPKDPIEQHSSYDFAILPIECRHYFKKARQRCRFETIKLHLLENKHKTLEDERENKLHSSFPRQTWEKIAEFVKNVIRKPLKSKNNSDRKRLDNLLLDQIRKKSYT